jgi:hypothetical protein
VAYDNSGGNGGAYVNAAGFHSLVAPVHLPHGAVVTEFTVFFDDTSTDDMTVNLWGQFLWGGGYTQMAQVISSGTAGYYSKSDTTISSATIDNSPPSAYGYYIQAYSGAWSSSLKIKGAAITYTIDEAP